MGSEILTSRSPRIDVHGETYDSVSLYLNQFVVENYNLGNKYIAIIHGKGSGILKNRIHELLKNNKYVEKYYLNNWNIGETVIILKKKVDKCSKK